MASRMLNALKKTREIHAVGNLNSGRVETIAHGAIAKADTENYSLVTLGFSATGEREFTVAKADSVAKDLYLLAGAEELFTVGGVQDSYADFYVGAGERARIVVLKKGLRFETSNFKVKTPATPVKNGDVVEWNAVDKKFEVVVTQTAGYVGAKIIVVAPKGNTLDGQKCMRFEVQ